MQLSFFESTFVTPKKNTVEKPVIAKKAEISGFKKIHPLAAVLQTADITKTENGCTILVKQELDRKTYEDLNNLFIMSGGIYKNRATGHAFSMDPDLILSHLSANIQKMENGKKINQEEYFPTPDNLADQVIQNLLINDRYVEYLMEPERSPETIILEPSAGDGSLIRALLRAFPETEAKIVAFEIDPLRAEALRKIQYANLTVIEGDFMTEKSPYVDYDICIMNPPFKYWSEHFKRARSLLKTRADGQNSFIAAILPDLSTITKRRARSDVKNHAIDLISEGNEYGFYEKVESGAFKSNAKTKDRIAGGTTNIATSIFVGTAKPRVRDDRISMIATHIENDFTSHKKLVENINRSNESIEKILLSEQARLLEEGCPLGSDINMTDLIKELRSRLDTDPR